MINPKPASADYSPYKIGTQLPNPNATPPKPPRRWKKVLLGIFVFLVVAGATFVLAEYHSIKQNTIVAGEGDSHDLLNYSASTASSIDWSKFQQPGDGRFNVLVLGIGGINDAGQVHDGTNLTDSIQLVSLDTINKKVNITSVPRDFYYDIPGYGPNKINAVYSFASLTSTSAGGAAARAAVGKVLGVNISNFIVIDFTAAKDAVNEVGGVDVDVPTAIYDPTYPCDDQIHYCPFSISAGEHHMDGTTALEYMRTRHDDSDFARSARQQAVIAALKAKALSLGTLSNPITVNSLIQTFSQHFKTDLQPSEIESFISIYKSISTANTTTAVLDTDPTEGLLTSSYMSGVGDIESPTLGYSNYSAIHTWYAQQAPDPFIGKEAATISIASSPEASAAQTQHFIQTLKDYGFNVAVVALPDTVSLPKKTTLYSSNPSSKPVTANYLGTLLGTKVVSAPPLGTSSNFEIIYVP